MTGNEFHDQLDAFYAAGDAAGAYAFLRSSRDGALAEDNKALLLTVDNALIGHCRENEIFGEVEDYYREALACIEALSLHGTHAEATTFLNTATAYCRMGRDAESEQLYDAAEALYRQLLPPGDPYMAAIRNNRGLLLRSQGKRAEAYAAFAASREILADCPGDVAAERAATLLNMVSVCPDLSEARALLAEASEYYDTPDGRRDIHRFTAMAAEAELAYRAGDFAGAGAAFEKTADAWALSGGARPRLAVLCGNAAACYAKAGDAASAARMQAKQKEASGQ